MSDLSMEPVVVIHGGAWAIPDKLSSASVEGVCSAARAGYDVLIRGGSATDAVEAAVRVMEDCPAFDAGILQRQGVGPTLYKNVLVLIQLASGSDFKKNEF